MGFDEFQKNQSYFKISQALLEHFMCIVCDKLLRIQMKETVII